MRSLVGTLVEIKKSSNSSRLASILKASWFRLALIAIAFSNKPSGMG
jgi:hypothetical protein